MLFFVDHQRWILSFLATLVLCATSSPIEPHTIEVARTDSSNSCDATFMSSSGRYAYAVIGESVTFWLKFSLSLPSCIQSVSFGWYNCCKPLREVVPIQVSDNVYFSNFTVNIVSNNDFIDYFFKASDETLETFSVQQERKCSDVVPNATSITPDQIRPSGSTVNITCNLVGDASLSTANIVWRQDDTYLIYNDDCQKMDICTQTFETSNNCTFSNSLIIRNVTTMKSGSYTCLPVAASGMSEGISQTTNLKIVPLPTVLYERQLSCKHFHACLQWKVFGYSNYTQLFVVVNDQNFTDYKHSNSTASDGNMLYTVNITKSESLQAVANDIELCTQLDSEVMQDSPSYPKCSKTTFSISSSKLVYYLIPTYPVPLLIPVAMIVILVICMVRRYQKNRAHKEEMIESFQQPLLRSNSPTQRSLHDSIHSSITRVARRLTASVSTESIDHDEDDDNKVVFILYCKPNGPSGNRHVDDVKLLAECLRLGSHKFRCEFDDWHTDYVAVWTNWTTRMIKDADFVILVCTDQFCSVLSQEMGQTFETCRGTVSSAVVTNLLTTYCHKFIPVFLNTKVEQTCIPPALLSTTAYELNLEELDMYIAKNGDKMNEREAMNRYLAKELPSMEGLIGLLKQLRGE